MTDGGMWLVRHGATAWSLSGQHTSHTDLPLEPEGRVQAEAIGTWLAGQHFTLVLTSPRVRALETCVLAGWGQAAEVTDDLREWDYGDYEGRTTEDIREDWPGWSLWSDGAPAGETAAEVGRRADRVIERCRAAGGETLCFAHGHFLRVLAARWVGLPPAGGRLMTMGAGSLSRLGWEREVAVIDRWNWQPN